MMLSVSSPLASAAERGAPSCRLRTTLLPRTSSQVAKPAQAGALTTPPLPESCRAASSARIASRALWSVVLLAESAAFVAYEASSGLGGKTQQGICYLGVYLQRRVQPVHRREKGGLAEEGGVQGCRGDNRGSVHGRLQGVSSQGAGIWLGGLQPWRRLGALRRASSGVILATMSRERWSTAVLRP